jgi:hypothetical protein
VIVLDDNSQFGNGPNVWDVNYAADASKNYNPAKAANWFFINTSETNASLGIAISSPAAAAVVSPPGDIALFNNTAQNIADTGPRPIDGVQIIERKATTGGAFVAASDTLMVNAGLIDSNDDFFVTPTPVLFGKQGSDCDLVLACRDGVFFINGAQNIQYFIWGEAVPADAWERTRGIRTVGWQRERHIRRQSRRGREPAGPQCRQLSLRVLRAYRHLIVPEQR